MIEPGSGAPIDPTPAVAATDSASTTRKSPRRFLFIIITVLAVLIVGISIGEVAVRQKMPELLPRKSDYGKSDGMPVASIDSKLRNIKQQQPDFILVGDSHVETGSIPGGWISHLSQITGKKFADFGISGTGPTQYFILLDRLRKEGITTPVIMVINIGNDFFDDGLWASLGEDKSGYLEARGQALNDPASPQFWPCMDGRATLASWLAGHSALYRAFFFAKYKLETRFAKDKPATTPEENEQLYVALMDNKCAKPPHAERVNGRLFFFDEHEAQLDDRDSVVAEGKARVRKLLEARCGEPNLWILFALTREETSEGFHGRKLSHSAPFIEEMKGKCPKVIDPNPAFLDATLRENLYLPDSHWNLAGGRLIAEQIKKSLGL